MKTGKDTIEVLTTKVDGKKTLPIFSFEEEADLFCRFLARDDCWIRETSSGELASILCGPCASVKTLILDPLPEICDRGMIHLVSVGRENFVRTLLGKWEPRLVIGRGLRNRQTLHKKGGLS